MIVLLDIFLGFCGLFYYFLLLLLFFILSLSKSLKQKGQSITPHPHSHKKKMVGQKKPSCLLAPASCHSLSDVKLTIFSITGNHCKITISWYSLSIWQLGVFLCIGLLLIILSSFKLKLCICPVITPIYYCKASNMSEW